MLGNVDMGAVTEKLGGLTEAIGEKVGELAENVDIGEMVENVQDAVQGD